MLKFIQKYFYFALLGTLFMVLEVLMDLLQPSLMKKIVDEGVIGVSNLGQTNFDILVNTGILMVVLAIVGCACGSLNSLFINLYSHKTCNEMRKRCFRSVMSFSIPQSEKIGAGTLITRMTNDITQTQNFLAMIFRGMVRTSFMTIGSIYFMFRLDSDFGFAVLLALPVAVVLLAYFMKKLTTKFTELQKMIDLINSQLRQNISNMRIIKACVQEISVRAKFSKLNIQTVSVYLFIAIVMALISPVVSIIAALLIAYVLLAGSFDVASGATSPGAIMAGITYLSQLLHAVMMMIMLFQSMSRGRASVSRIAEIIGYSKDFQEGNYSPLNTNSVTIEFRNVSFSYPDGERNVLENISFTVLPGETMAIIGGIGSGKSTIINLLEGFIRPTSGQILLNGHDLNEYEPNAFRKLISVALQQTELFSKSVVENIKLGNDSASFEDAVQAASIAQADGFIREMPQGYETILTERGKNLSGGQRQRVALARALVKKAPVLLLDDATSALDLATEKKFHNAMHQNCPNTVRIMVAQRISSVIGADHILVLDRGEIVGIGKHNQLLESCEIYQEISRIQSEAGMIGGAV